MNSTPEAAFLLERWRYFEETQQDPRLIPQPYQKRSFGDSLLIFCAPHATKLFARGRLKATELRTGSLADMLAEQFGGLSIKTIGYPLSTAPLKDEVAVIARGKTLFDFHGMSDNYEIDLCIGLGKDPDELANKICQSMCDRAQKHQLRYSVNAPFAATAGHTITKIVQEHGGRALQLEVSRACRDLDSCEKSAAMAIAIAEGIREALL